MMRDKREMKVTDQSLGKYHYFHSIVFGRSSGPCKLKDAISSLTLCKWTTHTCRKAFCSADAKGDKIDIQQAYV